MTQYDKIIFDNNHVLYGFLKLATLENEIYILNSIFNLMQTKSQWTNNFPGIEK